jgi:cytoskeletal protein CcmA (bactofilin family)
MAFAANKKTDSKETHDFKAPEPPSKSFFGKTMIIEGEVTSEEDVTIEGTVHGQLEVGKTLTIGKNGCVQGSISAAVVKISGEVEGEVTASEKLEISSEGKYKGDIKSNKLTVAEGAKIQANINLDDSFSKKKATPIGTGMVAQPVQNNDEKEDTEKKKKHRKHRRH